MGSIAKVIKKVTKSVTKPVSKAFKGVAKGIMKVGKATMRGISQINKKLGPLGSIALAVAMPYALSGLSTGTTALMNSQNVFLKSIGTIGNQIRTGYQAFNTGISKTFSSITKSISKSFQRFAPKSVKNMYSSISEGAKNLFQSAKTITQKYSPIKGQQGTVQISDMGYGFGETTTMTSSQAAKALELGTIDASQISGQTLGSNKWFVQGSQQTDKLITDTINEAYKSTYNSFSPNAQTYFNDLKRRATDIKTYVNDAEIGSAVENSLGATKSYATDFSTTPYNIDIDFSKTNDYVEIPNGGYRFTGEKTFSNQPVKTASSDLMKAAKKTAFKFGEGLLKPKSDYTKPYELSPTQDMTFETAMTGYGGTDITGTSGGDLITKVYGVDAANRIKNYYKNMNLIADYA
jgi:hypothetical protein